MWLSLLQALLTTLVLFSHNLIVNNDFVQWNDVTGLSIRYGVEYLRKIFSASSVESTIVFVLLAIVYYVFRKNYKEKKKDIQIVAAVLAAIYALCTVIGTNMVDNGNFTFVLGTKLGFLLSVAFFLVDMMLYYTAIYMLLNWFRNKRFADNGETEKKWKVLLFDDHPMIATAAVMGVCWLPYMVFFFPGTMNWDGLRQLDFYIGSLEWTQFHPVVSTWFMGTIFKIGQTIFHSDNMGVFLFTIIQVIWFVCAIGYGMCLLKKWKTPYWFRICVLGFFALVPTWSSYAYTFIKDTSYGLWMFLFVLLLMEFVLDQEHFYWHKWAALFVTALGACFTRNNGIHVLILSIPFLVWIAKRNRIKMSIVLVVPAAITLMINNVLAPTVGIGDGTVVEMLSIPFQQTARYVKYYGDEVTPEEEAVIRTVLNYDKLADLYDPELSDPVKSGTAARVEENHNLKEYFKVWWQQFLKHPLCYVEATINNVYQYIYPVVVEDSMVRTLGNFSHATDPYVNRGDFHFTMPEKWQGMRESITQIAYGITSVPVIGLFLTTGMWTWILILGSAIFILEKQYRMLATTVPLWLTLLVCIASPVNGSIRYLLPNMIVLPFVMGCVLFVMSNREEKKNG